MNMKKTIKHINIAAILLLLLGSCAVTDVDRSADFTQYRTFSWGEAQSRVTSPEYKSDLIDKKIRTSVEEEFAKRGVVYSKKNPDFIVSFQTVTEEKEQQTGGLPYYGFGSPFYAFPFYRFGYGFGFPYWGAGPSMYSYTEGTLIIDVIDKKTDELVWRGTVSGNVDNVGSLQKQLDKAVRAIMKKYPVKAGEGFPVSDKKEIS
jgi:hypothetical protein